jgi:hypothetical protein
MLRVRTVLPEARIAQHGSTLVVRATAAEHARLAAVLGDLRQAGRGAGDAHAMRLAHLRLEEVARLLEQLKEQGRRDEALRNASKSLFELRVFREHLQKQVEARGQEGPTEEQQAAMRRLDEGTQRLLAEVVALRDLGAKEDERGVGVRVVGPDGKERDVRIVRREAVKKGEAVVEVPIEKKEVVILRAKDGKALGGALQSPREAPDVFVLSGKEGKPIVLGPDGKPVPGAVVTEKDEQGRFRVSVLQGPGQVEVEWEKAAGRGEGDRPFHVQVEKRAATATKALRRTATWENVEALKQRVARLEQAAKLLQESGLPQEAERARQAAKEALARLHAQAETGSHGGEMLEAVNALRRDVNQLRGEVRELTHLVRKLLEQR